METLDVSKMTDEQLTERINVRSKAIDVTRKDVALMEADLANMRTELRRRKLAAFWQANEGLRLEVGDALLVTEEFRNDYRGAKEFTVLDVFVVDSIDIENVAVKVIYKPTGRKQPFIELPIARRMRLAYLQAHGEAQP